jgi:hypothetical protein
MTSTGKGNDVAQEGSAAMSADYGQRAATALDQLIPGPHRDKAVARLFGVSVRFAKYLRAGRHWTTGRLAQASVAFGGAFDAALYTPASDARHYREMAEIADRLARLEAWRAQMDRGAAARPPPPEGIPAPRPRPGPRRGAR